MLAKRWADVIMENMIQPENQLDTGYDNGMQTRGRIQAPILSTSWMKLARERNEWRDVGECATRDDRQSKYQKMLLEALILSAVATLGFADVYQIPLIRVESQMVKMIRNKTWAAYVKKMEARRKMSDYLPFRDGKEIYSQEVRNYNDIEYLGIVTIGTPQQKFKVVLDTGSSDFWIPDYTCAEDKPLVCDESLCDRGLVCEVFCPNQECCNRKNVENKRNPCRGKNFFNSNLSTTYIAMEKRWNIAYGTGSAEGFFGNDTVRLGSEGTKQLKVPGCQFGQADSIADFFASHPIDGILGMGFSTLSASKVVPVFERAHILGLVEPVFTVYYKRAGYGAEDVYGGVFTYGGLDTAHCGEVVAYQNLSFAAYWQFKMDAVSVGKYRTATGWQVISDTGTSFIGAEYNTAMEIAKELNATYSDEEKIFYIDCNAKADIVLMIGGRDYTIESANTIMKVEEDICILAVFPYMSWYAPYWILGDPFIRQFCNIHDMQNKRIGFAKSLQK